MNKNEIILMIQELKKAAEVYYQGETSMMSDNEYDAKIELLERNKSEITDEDILNEIDSLLNTVSAGSEPGGIVVHHDYPMLSLGKADSHEELKRYYTRLVNGGAKGFTLQAKLDGLALSAKYSNGKLIQLATRGDGLKGESLSHLISHDEVEILGLPVNIDHKEDFELRGELYMTKNQFEVVNQSRFAVVGEWFSNSRNAAVGITKRSISGLGYQAELSFTAYSSHVEGKLIDINKISGHEIISRVAELTQSEIDKLADFKAVNCSVKSLDFSKLSEAVDSFGELREHFGIPTDGVVIKPINEIEMLNKMGYTSRFPVAYIAYKYPGTSAITTVEEITVSVGKTGRLTPQAKVKPVEIDGVVISNITCHNYSWLNEMGIRVGSVVSVTRANDVIPAIDKVIDKGSNNSIITPKDCPECGEKLHSDGSAYPKTLTCENKTCSSRVLYYMKSIVGRNYLYIEGLGDVALEALVNTGTISSIVDLFKLNEETLKAIPTGKTSTGNIRLLGDGNARNIMKSIELAKENTDSNKLLASLNIDRVGPNTAKRLIAYFGGIREVLDADVNLLTNVDQVGSSLIKSFQESRERASSELNELISLGVKVNDPVVDKSKESKGSFSVSGAVEGFSNRNEFVEYMEKEGWEFHRSPKKDTDVLFADPSGTSSKTNRARKNGTRIVKDLNDL